MSGTATDRNAPCPCGSGLKYKNCCLRKAAKPAPVALPPAAARLLHEAQAKKAKQDHQGAAELYKKVLASHPKLPRALGGLGHTLGLAGRQAQGMRMVREAVALDEASPELRHYLAELTFLDRDPEGALEQAEIALEAEPKRLDSLTLAARSLERLNRVEEALAYAERAVSAKRTDPEANLILARLEVRARRFDDARGRLDKLVSRRTTPTEIHHQALTERGFLLDKLGEYDDAYEAFDQAGREIAATPAVQRINPRAAYDRLEGYRGRFTPARLGRFSGESFDTPAPYFLVGFPRSGTTMTEQVLAAHPRVVTSDERPFINAVGQRVIAGTGSDPDIAGLLDDLDADRVGELRRVYWAQAEGQFEGDLGDRVFIDKLPLNIVELGMINTIFPDARLLVALRDPRDVCLSCFMQWFAPNPAMIQLLTLDSAARFYAAVMGLYLELREVVTLPLLEVRYEDTVSDLETQGRRIIDHLGLEWHHDLLSFQEKARQRAIRTPSYAAVTEKVHTRAVGRWRHYARRFDPLQDTLSPFVAEFGYTEQ